MIGGYWFSTKLSTTTMYLRRLAVERVHGHVVVAVAPLGGIVGGCPLGRTPRDLEGRAGRAKRLRVLGAAVVRR